MFGIIIKKIVFLIRFKYHKKYKMVPNFDKGLGLGSRAPAGHCHASCSGFREP